MGGTGNHAWRVVQGNSPENDVSKWRRYNERRSANPLLNGRFENCVKSENSVRRRAAGEKNIEWCEKTAVSGGKEMQESAPGEDKVGKPRERKWPT